MTTEVALIVGGGPGISASCARLFSREGMQVAVAARTPDEPVLTRGAAPAVRQTMVGGVLDVDIRLLKF